MKYILFLLILTFSIQSFSQTDSSAICGIRIKLYDKSYSGRIKRKDVKVLFINGKDSINPNPDLIYYVSYPFINTKLSVKYKDFYAVIDSDKYLNYAYTYENMIYISIIILPNNKSGAYIVSYERREYGSCDYFGIEINGKKVKKANNFLFYDFYSPVYPEIR